MYADWFREVGYNGTVRHYEARLGFGGHIYQILVGIPFKGMKRTKGSIILRVLRDFDTYENPKDLLSFFS